MIKRLFNFLSIVWSSLIFLRKFYSILYTILFDIFPEKYYPTTRENSFYFFLSAQKSKNFLFKQEKVYIKRIKSFKEE